MTSKERLQPNQILGLVSAWTITLNDTLKIVSPKFSTVKDANAAIKQVTPKLTQMAEEVKNLHQYLLNPTKKLLFTPVPLKANDLAQEFAEQKGVFLVLLDEDGNTIKKPLRVAEDPTLAEDVAFKIGEETAERKFDLTRKMLYITVGDSQKPMWISKKVSAVRLLVSDGHEARYVESKSEPLMAIAH